MMRKHNKIISLLFMFFCLSFDCLIRDGGIKWVEWIFADPIFLEEKDMPIFFFTTGTVTYIVLVHPKP